MIILGIDPGTLVLGYGLVKKEPKKSPQYIRHGQIRINGKMSFMERLGQMAQRVSELIKDVEPDVAVIEKIFLGRNVDSAFKLGHIRGVCICESQKTGAEVFEYTPRLVKQGITGSGSATKEQVQMLLYSQLGIGAPDKAYDASDALSLAYYHATQIDVIARFKGTGVEV